MERKGGEKMKKWEKEFYINEIQKVIDFLGNIDVNEKEISDYNLAIVALTEEKLKNIQGFLGKGDRD